LFCLRLSRVGLLGGFAPGQIKAAPARGFIHLNYLGGH